MVTFNLHIPTQSVWASEGFLFDDFFQENITGSSTLMIQYGFRGTLHTNRVHCTLHECATGLSKAKRDSLPAAWHPRLRNFKIRETWLICKPEAYTTSFLGNHQQAFLSLCWRYILFCFFWQNSISFIWDVWKYSKSIFEFESFSIAVLDLSLQWKRQVTTLRVKRASNRVSATLSGTTLPSSNWVMYLSWAPSLHTKVLVRLSRVSLQ